MNMLSVGMYRPPDVFNQCPSTELSLEAERLQNSMSHYERTGARGQFKIVSFSQGWFFPEASCCFNLRKKNTAISSLLIWALCLHTAHLFPAPLSPQLYIPLSVSWIFPFPPFFVSSLAYIVAMTVYVCLEICPSCIPSLYLGEMQVRSPSSPQRDLCHALSGGPIWAPARTRTARHAVRNYGPCWPKCLLIAEGSSFIVNHCDSLF